MKSLFVNIQTIESVTVLQRPTPTHWNCLHTAHI